MVTFDVKDFDTGSNFASSLFTAPVAGFYHFDTAVYIASASTATFIQWYKNGVVHTRGALYGNSSGDSAIPSSLLISLAATDTIGVHIAFVGGGTRALQNISGSERLTWFSGFLASAT